MRATANGVRIRCQMTGPSDAPVVMPSRSPAASLPMRDSQAAASRLLIVKSASHLSIIERVEAFNRAPLEFLSVP